MALNFPSAPMIGKLYPDPPLVGVPQYIFDGAAWVGSDSVGTLRKNYVINGAMMVSQEFPLTNFAVSTGWPADQYQVVYSHGGALSYAQVSSTSPAGSPNRIRITVTTPDAAVAASDFLGIYHRIEGLRVADLLFGTTLAKTITIRFGVKAPAGIYCVAFRNATVATRSYIAEYVIAASEANIDVVKSVTIPGDVTGTWAKDNSLGLEIAWYLMCGTNFQQAAGSWGTGNAVGSSNQFNFVGINGNVFELFDVGLYEGTVAPPFVVPDYPSELIACMRYFETGYSFIGYYNNNMLTGISARYDGMKFQVPKRASPTVTFSNWQYYNTGDAFVAVTPTLYTSHSDRFELVASGLTNFKAWASGGTWKASARL